MEPEDTREETRENVSDLEETTAAPQESISSTFEQARATLASGLNRRKFLAAAALGSAAAALVQKTGSGLSGVRIGPLTAGAHVPTGVNCTAGDIEVLSATILNEPCICTTTFDAVAAVVVRNDNNATRYCITLHLNPTGQDVLLFNALNADGTVNTSSGSSISGFGTTTMYGSLGTLPCNVPVLCFPDSVISFNPSRNNPCPTVGDINPAQCRRQDICFVGFGITAVCADGSCVQRSLTNGCCTVPCDGTLRVKITTQGETGAPCPANSSTLSVQRPGELSFTAITLTDGCYVDTSPVAGTYTFRVTDCHGCSRDTTLAVCVEQIATPTVTAGAPGCAGETTFTVTPCPPATGVTYTLERVDCITGEVIAWPTPPIPGPNCTFTVALPLGQTICVRVKASNGNPACDEFSATVTVVVPAQVTVLLDVTGEESCNGGQLTFTATASGGVGPYTFTFKKDGVIIPSTGNTAIVSPTLANGGLDSACHRITVEARDSRGCPITPATASITYQQCVTTTLGCTLPV